MEENLYVLGFSLFPGIGPVLFEKLIKKFGSAEAAWKSPTKALEHVLPKTLVEQLIDFRKKTSLKKEWEVIQQKRITIITLRDTTYPSLLKKLRIKPFLLYVKGNTNVLSSPKTIGIVGTRKITEYGREVTNMLAAGLVTHGFVTISGLALGVDACAHASTIDNNGKTIAVLGCGVDCCYPRENQRIYDAILAKGGTIISTFPAGMQASTGSFPARNAIIAGLSQAILVTEGAEDSGSLITAKDAQKIGRPVFAVPGPITSSLSKGANSLLKNGAIPVTAIGDILDSLGIMNASQVKSKKQKIKINGTKEEKEILALLENVPLHFDEIARRIKKDSKIVGSLLSLMELKGMIKSNTEGKFTI